MISTVSVNNSNLQLEASRNLASRYYLGLAGELTETATPYATYETNIGLFTILFV
jgi:hypothetical protein